MLLDGNLELRILRQLLGGKPVFLNKSCDCKSSLIILEQKAIVSENIWG